MIVKSIRFFRFTAATSLKPNRMPCAMQFTHRRYRVREDEQEV